MSVKYFQKGEIMMRSKKEIMRDIIDAHNDANTEVVSPRVEASVLIEVLIDIRDQLQRS